MVRETPSCIAPAAGALAIPDDAAKHTECRRIRHSAASVATSYVVAGRHESMSLRFENPILCRMISGRMIVRVDGSEPFEFLPSDTVFAAPGMGLQIAFPEADMGKPSEWLCIELDCIMVAGLVSRINQRRRSAGLRTDLALKWDSFALFGAESQIRKQMIKLLELYEDPASEFRDIRIEMAHEELLLLVLQARSRAMLVELGGNIPDTGLNAAVKRIFDDPARRWPAADLARLACMSEATFFRRFKARFGLSPARFASALRITRARSALAQHRISEVAYELGFASVEHFTRLYWQQTGETPGETQRRGRAASHQGHSTL